METVRRRDIVSMVIACGLILVLYYVGTPNFRSSADGQLYGGDYLQEWFGGLLVQRGQLAEHYDPDVAHLRQHDPGFMGFKWEGTHFFPMVYPPFYYAAVSPLSYLPYRDASRVWAALMVLCYMLAAGSIALFLARTHPRLAPRHALLVLPLGLLFPPVAESLVNNQKGTLCLLLLTSTFLLLRSGREVLAGGVFGILFFKPQLALPFALVMLWKRRERFWAGCMITLVVFGILAASTGLESCQSYVEFIADAPEYIYNSGYALSRSHCVDGFFHGIFDDRTSVARFGTIAVNIILVVTALAVFHGPLDFGSSRFLLQFSTLVLVTALVSPHLYGYDLAILLLPFALVLSFTRRHDNSRAKSVTRYLVISLFCLSGLSELLASASGIQLSVLLMLTLVAMLAYLLLYEEASVPARVA